MGNREALLAGARQCIYERGFAKTTARDIANVAGVSLAAIGYHFGTKDRLLTEALTEAVGTGMGDELEERMRAAGDGRSLADSFAPTWEGVAEVFAHNREAVVASAENLIRLHRAPGEQERTAEVSEQVYTEFAAILTDVHPDLTGEQARAVAKLYYTMMNGLALQWIMNPEGELPNGKELAMAIAALTPQQ